RKGRRWRLVTDRTNDRPDAALLVDLMKLLFQWKASQFVMERPTVSPDLIVQTQTQGPAHRLRLWVMPEGHWVAFHDEEIVGRKVDAKRADLLKRDAEAFTDRTLLAIKAEQLQSIRLERIGRHTARYTMRREGRNWVFDGLDPEACRRLIDALTPLRVDRWTSKKKPGATQIELSLVFRDGPSTRKDKLRIDAEGVGRLDEGKRTFVLSRELMKTLRSELKSKTLLPFSVRDIAAVITHGQTVVRDNGLYKRLGGGEVREQEAAKFFDHLAGLQAHRYLPSTEPPDAARRLVVVTRDNRTWELRLWTSENGTPMGVLNIYERTADLKTGRLDPSARPDKSYWFSLTGRSAERLKRKPF
ncbi:MAG: hypothetical protein R3236_10350, partial [Phycisphaeraceae bacterium]|nr:hypothetical protein [Phycisphaeraceae bacterium]